MNFIDRTGETRLMNCGLNATIIEYLCGAHITIKFEDGVIVEDREYKEFIKGCIKHPGLSTAVSHLRVGETKTMNCGLKATIIEYFSVRNITVEFEDGTIKRNKDYHEFKSGTLTNCIGHSNEFVDRTGETAMMNCGLKATIVEFKNNKNIIVQFEDGITKKTNYGCFKKRQISHSSNATNTIKFGRVEETKMMRCGLLAKIVKYKNKNKIDIEFEDGDVVRNKSYESFLRGTIANSSLSAKGISHYCGFECQVVIKKDNNTYYKVKHKDGFEGIMTPQEMIAYNK